MPHAYYMEKALSCAFSRIGITSPNPPVGAVIACNDDVIAVGVTMPYGGDHAEICALKQAGTLPSDSRMYVTLEPCCHFGQTPPCTEAIIRSGIRDVYVGTIDPNPVVSGKGVQALRDAGIRVTLMHEYDAACRELIRPFATLIHKKRPHVVHKAAMTLDGCTATKSGNSQWITSPDARALVHRYRSIVDAVIIGKGTYLSDNPTLSVRQTDIHNAVLLSGAESWYLKTLTQDQFPVRKENPLRVVIGRVDDLTNRNLFYDDNYLVFCSGNMQECVIPEYVNRSHIIELTSDSNPSMLYEVMQHLKNLGILYCMLEGGANLASSFYTADLIDETVYFYAPRILGGGYPLFSNPETAYISHGKTITDITVLTIGSDIGIIGSVGGSQCLPE